MKVKQHILVLTTDLVAKKNKGKQLRKRDDNIKGGRWFLVDKISAYLYL